MKNTLKKIGSFALLSAMLMSLALTPACAEENIHKGSSEGKKPLPESEYEDDITTPGEEEVDNTPEDPGTKVDHIFEAEAARFNGTSSNGTFDKGCIAQSYFFDFQLHGNVIIRNTNNQQNRFVYTFESDKAYKCEMDIALTSAYSGSGWTEQNLSAFYDIVINNKRTTADAVVPKGSEEEAVAGNMYNCVKVVTVPITIKEGTNIITFRQLSATNFDYINIKTSANITFDEPMYWDDEYTQISVGLPKADAAGTFTISCTEHGKTNTFALPALAKGNGYIENEDGSYSFTFCGDTYTINADGTYDFPAGVIVTGGVKVDDEEIDPSAPAIPSVIVPSKNFDFFAPANWTTFENGTVLGSKPTAINGALKFLEAARIDFFYVQGSNGNYSHLGDLSTNIANQATDEIYGKEYSWTLSMSSDDNFDMMLFGGKSAYATYATSGMGIYLCFEDGKISVRSANNGGEIGGVLTSGAAAGVVLDGKTKFNLTITACRVDDNNIKFKLAVNGAEVVFDEIVKDAEKTALDGNFVVSTFYGDGYAYGQRLCVMPSSKGIVRIWNLTLPGGTVTPPDEGGEEEQPGEDMPEFIVPNKNFNFFNPSSWTTFTAGSAQTGAPAVKDGGLEFEKAARIDFFYAQGTDGKYCNIADTKSKVSEGIYGNEYSWDIELSANGNFNMVLFGGASAPSVFNGSQAGIYLAFESGKISVSNAYYGSEVAKSITSANVAGVVLDGQTKFTVTLTVCRVSETELKFKLAVNDAAVEFVAASEDAECTAVADGWVVCTLESNGYGQRLCFVPGDGAMVKVWDVALPASQN